MYRAGFPGVGEGLGLQPSGVGWGGMVGSEIKPALRADQGVKGRRGRQGSGNVLRSLPVHVAIKDDCLGNPKAMLFQPAEGWLIEESGMSVLILQ